MPLQAHCVGGIRCALGGLDYAVLGAGDGAEALAGARHGLVVERVDQRCAVADPAGEPARGLHLDGVPVLARLGLSVLDPVDHVRVRVGVLRRDVLREGTAVGDRQDLAAAADAEDRDALPERGTGDAELEGVVLRRNGVDRRVGRLAVVRRVDVLAAGQYDAVEVLKQFVDVTGRRIARQGDHQGTRGGERLAEVSLDGDQQGIGQLKRDADAGTTGHVGTLPQPVGPPQSAGGGKPLKRTGQTERCGTLRALASVRGRRLVCRRSLS